jgi:hypothetical protein
VRCLQAPSPFLSVLWKPWCFSQPAQENFVSSFPQGPIHVDQQGATTVRSQTLKTSGFCWEKKALLKQITTETIVQIRHGCLKKNHSRNMDKGNQRKFSEDSDLAKIVSICLFLSGALNNISSYLHMIFKSLWCDFIIVHRKCCHCKPRRWKDKNIFGS